MNSDVGCVSLEFGAGSESETRSQGEPGDGQGFL